MYIVHVFLVKLISKKPYIPHGSLVTTNFLPGIAIPFLLGPGLVPEPKDNSTFPHRHSFITEELTEGVDYDTRLM